MKILSSSFRSRIDCFLYDLFVISNVSGVELISLVLSTGFGLLLGFIGLIGISFLAWVMAMSHASTTLSHPLITLVYLPAYFGLLIVSPSVLLIQYSFENYVIVNDPVYEYPALDTLYSTWSEWARIFYPVVMAITFYLVTVFFLKILRRFSGRTLSLTAEDKTKKAKKVYLLLAILLVVAIFSNILTLAATLPGTFDEIEKTNEWKRFITEKSHNFSVKMLGDVPHSNEIEILESCYNSVCWHYIGGYYNATLLNGVDYSLYSESRGNGDFQFVNSSMTIPWSDRIDIQDYAGYETKEKELIERIDKLVTFIENETNLEIPKYVYFSKGDYKVSWMYIGVMYLDGRADNTSKLFGGGLYSQIHGNNIRTTVYRHPMGPSDKTDNKLHGVRIYIRKDINFTSIYSPEVRSIEQIVFGDRLGLTGEIIEDGYYRLAEPHIILDAENYTLVLYYDPEKEGYHAEIYPFRYEEYLGWTSHAKPSNRLHKDRMIKLNVTVET